MAIGNAAVHVDAQHLAQQHAGILRAVLRIAAAAAVAQADVEVAVGAKLELAAVVVGVGLDRRSARICALAGLARLGSPALTL